MSGFRIKCGMTGCVILGLDPGIHFVYVCGFGIKCPMTKRMDRRVVSLLAMTGGRHGD